MVLATALAAAMPWQATRAVDLDAAGAGSLPYLQCVPYARQVSGIRIYGDAHTWWRQAQGHYATGSKPKIGAVMSFRPYGGMRLGHVAAVSRIVDSRTVLLRHANWSPINGRRGQIEDDVRAIDVSEDNDWSKVRVWYAPIKALGGTEWPLNGFIYNEKPRKPGKVLKPGKALPVDSALAPAKPAETRPGRIAPALDKDPIGAIIAGLGK